jgi:hypothetical protein
LTCKEDPDRIVCGVYAGEIGVAARRIECTSKKTRDGRRFIAHIGGSSKDGGRWTLPHEDAIRDIESGKMSYYCDTGGQSYLVIVAEDKSGAKFIKAVIDGDVPDSLLRLPDCP